MNLRVIRREFRAGKLVIVPGDMAGKSGFQARRLTEATAAARVYLAGKMTTLEMGQSLGVTEERAAQIVRLGVGFMRSAGWLTEPRATAETAATPILELSDRGPC